MSKKLENAIIIGGKVYELIDDREVDECQRCALLMSCGCCDECLCELLFECEDVFNKRFKER